MSKTSPNAAKSTQPATPSGPEPANSQEPVQTVEGGQPEPQKADAAPNPTSAAKSDMTIVSISVSSRLASKARLLARIRGCTISSLFTEAAAREIPQQLKLALADLKDEDLE